jgi:hypothetical protein
MDLNAKYGQLLLRCLLQWIQIRISAKRGKCTWNSNLQTKCRTERRFHALKFSDGYKSTMDWCSIYLTPSCNNVAPMTNLCLGRATTRSHSSQWSKKKSCSWNIKTRVLTSLLAILSSTISTSSMDDDFDCLLAPVTASSLSLFHVW